MIQFKVLVVLLFAIVVFIGCNQSAQNTANNVVAPSPAPSPTPKDDATIASDLYTVNCMTCHRDSGKGGPTTVDGNKLDPDDITKKEIRDETDEALLKQISDGDLEDGMPAFKEKLSQDEIKRVITHVRKLQVKSEEAKAANANVPAR